MMPLIKSWVTSANNADTDFPLNNLPYGVFSIGNQNRRCGVAIGDMILDITTLEAEGLLNLTESATFDAGSWNNFMSLGPAAWSDFRGKLQDMLRAGSASQQKLEALICPQAAATMYLPFKVAEYTDFYAGRNHATNVGTMFRGAENALPPNWLHIPIGYNGRSSSVVVSGTNFHRPWGQLKPADAAVPFFAPSKRFDIELELGAVIGTASTFGKPVTVAEADEMIFGYVLLNDWSARDIQAWEYQPLGPFQAKATATTISPWIVTKAALESFRVSTPPREVPLLHYLAEPGPMLYDIKLEVGLTPERGRETLIARTSSIELYYSAAQQLAHHTTSGCAMTVGDLLGSGTISGPTKESRGSLLEISWGGKEPFAIDGGTRSFIEDNDTLILRGHAQGDGFKIGFGECSGKVLPALPNPYQR
jgi:fumarylacetoacetase